MDVYLREATISRKLNLIAPATFFVQQIVLIITLSILALERRNMNVPTESVLIRRIFVMEFVIVLLVKTRKVVNLHLLPVNQMSSNVKMATVSRNRK